MSFNNRPDRPVEAPTFIKIITEKELRKPTVKTFYNTVKESAPENVLSHFEVSGPNGEPEQAFLVHRLDESGKHEYEIPLVRNLTPNEIYEVMMNLDTKMNEGDFLLETSTFDEDCCGPEETIDLSEYMEPQVFERIAEKIAERMHNKWYNEREAAGWRYGPQRLDEEKTHPLMKPWSRLTESEKQIDYSLPQFLIDVLDECGYSIISHNEVEGIIEQLSKK